MMQPDRESRRRRLLLIEDDRDLSSLMQDYMAQHGFDAEPAFDGRQGLARALEAVSNS